MGEDWYTCSVCGQPTSDYQDVSCGNKGCHASYCRKCAEELSSFFGKALFYSKDYPQPKKCWECAIDKDKDKEIKKLEKKENKYKLKIYEIKKQIKAHIIKTYKENEKSSSKDDEKQSDTIDSKRQQ